MREALTYDDVLLVPQYSDIESRSEVSISNKLGDGIQLDMPIISSPMDTVTEGAMAMAMCHAGGLGVVHRYNTIDQQADIVSKAYYGNCKNIAAAIGMGGDFFGEGSCCYQGWCQHPLHRCRTRASLNDGTHT